MENFNFCVGTRILFGKDRKKSCRSFYAHMEIRYC